MASISAFTTLQVFANRGLVDTIHYPQKKLSCIHHHQPEVDHQQREFPKIIDIMYLIFANFGGTTTLFRPVKRAPKSAQICDKIANIGQNFALSMQKKALT